MATLADYLADFEAAEKPTTASKPGLVQMDIAPLQRLLNQLGEKLTQDGLFGPGTKGAWARQAQKRRLEPAFDRAGPKWAWVSQQTYAALSAAAYPAGTVAPASKPAVAKPAAKAAPKAAPKPAAKAAPKPAAKPVAAPKPVAAGLVDKPVAELQQLLYGVGWTSKKLTNDGLYGPQTKSAWGVSAKLRKLPVTFDRVDGRTARVALATYDKIKADGSAAPKPAPAPAPGFPAPAPAAAPTGLVDKSVAELQGILYGVGWTTKKLPSDGAYGPKTKAAWEGSSKLRGLPATFTRVDGRTARVDATTYEALKAKMPATKITPAPAPKPGPGPAPAPGPAAPAGTVNKLVAELQGILYGVGWTTKKLPSDGAYGPKTKAAWEGSAKLRGLPTTFVRVDGRTARVDATTYEALKAKMPATKVPDSGGKKTPAPKPAPAPVNGDLITKPVLEVQKLLQAIGWKARTVATNGKFDANTQKAWIDSAKRRGLSTTFTKVDARTVKLNKSTFDTIQSEVTKKKPDVPAPAPQSTLSPGAKAVIQLATVKVSAETLQQAMARTAALRSLEPLPITGVWGQSDIQFFTKQVIQKPDTIQFWLEAFPSLVSADGKTVMMPDTIASVLPTLANAWIASQQKTVPSPSPGPTPPVDGPVGGNCNSLGPQYSEECNRLGWDEYQRRARAGQYEPPAPPSPNGGYVPPAPPSPGPAPMPVYDNGGGGGGGAPEPFPEEPAPPPAPDNSAAVESWGKAVAALQSLTQKAPEIEKAFVAAQERGPIHPEVQAKLDAWLQAADKLTSTLSNVISGSPELRSALDASGPGVGFAGLSGYGQELAVYFGELEAVADKAIELLRTPFYEAAAIVLKGFEQAGPALSWAARLGAPAWTRLLELLRLPVVTVAGGTAIAGKTITDAINGETEAYLSHEDALAQLVAEGKLTTDEYNNLKKDIPEQKSIIGPVILGVVALGGFALYLKNRGGDHARTR